MLHFYVLTYKIVNPNRIREGDTMGRLCNCGSIRNTGLIFDKNTGVIFDCFMM